MLKIITKKQYESLLNQIKNLKKENEKLQNNKKQKSGLYLIYNIATELNISNSRLYNKIKRHKYAYEQSGYIIISQNEKTGHGNNKIYITEEGKKFFRDIYMKG